MITVPTEKGKTMAENYKHLYEQTKKMLTMYQDELIPGFRKQIEELETKNKWIPVTERLPEKHTNVFVYRPKMAIKFMVSYFGVDCFCDGAMDIHGNEVITHWMPLPELPQEVSDGQT
jgi:hypothetical protein